MYGWPRWYRTDRNVSIKLCYTLSESHNRDMNIVQTFSIVCYRVTSLPIEFADRPIPTCLSTSRAQIRLHNADVIHAIGALTYSVE